MKFSKLSLLQTVTLASSLGLTAANDCTVDQEELDFTFFLDEDSITENGFSLTCESSSSLQQPIVWNVPMGALEEKDIIHIRAEDSEAPYVRKRVCLSTDAACTFTVEDLYGDGIQSPGYYTLTFGATTIAVSKQGEEFFEKSYCFGEGCPEVPIEDQQDECDDLYLFFGTDNSPEQSSVTIECDGEVILKSGFGTPQEHLEWEYCLPTNKCCNLFIEDLGSDGIDTSQGGSIYFEWANNMILKYDEENPFKFTRISREFGVTCDAQDDDVALMGFDDEEGEEDETNDEDGEDLADVDEESDNTDSEAANPDSPEDLADVDKESDNADSEATNPDSPEDLADVDEESDNADSEATNPDSLELDDETDDEPALSLASKIVLAIVITVLALGFILVVIDAWSSSSSSPPRAVSKSAPAKDLEIKSAGSLETEIADDDDDNDDDNDDDDDDEWRLNPKVLY